jgi:hypothetical protein
VSTRRVIHAVERAASEVGGTVSWQMGTRHRNCLIRLPNGNEIKTGISYGMNFDEMRVLKMVRGLIRKGMKNDQSV